MSSLCDDGVWSGAAKSYRCCHIYKGHDLVFSNGHFRGQFSPLTRILIWHPSWSFIITRSFNNTRPRHATDNRHRRPRYPRTHEPIPIAYGFSSHHALGGGSYVFKPNYCTYLKTLLTQQNSRTEINIIIQPNCSAHIGTLCSLGLAFVISRRMADLGLDVAVTCDLWDRAKGEQTTIDGVIY